MFTSLETTTGARTLHGFANGVLSTLSSSNPPVDSGALPLEPSTYDAAAWDNRYALSSSPDGAWVVWDTGAGVEAVQTRTGRKLALDGVRLPVDAWAPDGKSFTFLSPAADAYNQQQLSVVSLATGRVVTLAGQADPGLIGRDARSKLASTASVWSPDGSVIAYRVWRGAVDGSADLYSVRPDGSENRLIASSVVACNHVWSADGKWIGFVARDAADSGAAKGTVAAVRPDGSGKVIVHTLADGHGSCSVAPVGAAWLSISEPTALTVVLANGTGARRLAEFERSNLDSSILGFDPIATVDTPLVEWSPNGEILAAASPVASHPFLTIRRDGSELHTQYAIPPTLLAFTFWSPNSRHFVAVETLGDAEAGTGVRFGRKTFQFSPEGTRMLFMDGGAFVMRPDQTEKILLAEPPPPVENCQDLPPGTVLPTELSCKDGRLRAGDRYPRFIAGFLDSEDQIVILSGDRLDEYRLSSGKPARHAIWTPGPTETLTAAALPTKLYQE